VPVIHQNSQYIMTLDTWKNMVTYFAIKLIQCSEKPGRNAFQCSMVLKNKWWLTLDAAVYNIAL
jgi:hypothetical protein